MARKSYVWDPVIKDLVPKEEYRERLQGPTGPFVLPDIQPYQSMIDGTMITSRSQHRAHLREHRCIEVGNERIEPPKRTLPPGRTEALVNAYRKIRGR